MQFDAQAVYSIERDSRQAIFEALLQRRVRLSAENLLHADTDLGTDFGESAPHGLGTRSRPARDPLASWYGDDDVLAEWYDTPDTIM